MKILLIAVNAKYIHSCPAVYSLKAYADKYKISDISIEIAEYTINDRYSDILSDIAQRHPDAAAFSTYIWNVTRVRQLMRDLRTIFGETIQIWAGGPESTNAPEKFLTGCGSDRLADLCMQGEGEETFRHLVDHFAADPDKAPADLPGLALPQPDGRIHFTGPAAPVDMDRIPFLYNDLTLFDNRIIYYESSRGCPYHCSYCLSSLDRRVRFRNISTVEKELQYFLDNKVRQVKFVDRTFNCSHAHADAIWHYIAAHDNGITNFHFEMEADLLTEEEIDFLNTLRPGLVQMEIGIQSVNPETLQAVGRTTDTDRIERAVDGLRRAGNINIHLDLIAGLPYEDAALFCRSFNRVYAMRPEQLQLGFLKVLRGTEMARRSSEFGIFSSANPPYQVLKTRWMSFDELAELERISDMVEDYYNSLFFRRSLPYIETLFETPFDLYRMLAAYSRRQGYFVQKPAARKRYDVMKDFIKENCPDENLYRQLCSRIDFDKALHFNASRRMQAIRTFDFGDGPQTFRIDYSRRSPVNGEASVSAAAADAPFSGHP